MPEELRELIRRMARENVLWGEERIASELLLKLGVRISPRTVRNVHAETASGAAPRRLALVDVREESGHSYPPCDFFVAVTATFGMLCVFVVIEHGVADDAHSAARARRSSQWGLQNWTLSETLRVCFDGSRLDDCFRTASSPLQSALSDPKETFTFAYQRPRSGRSATRSGERSTEIACASV